MLRTRMIAAALAFFALAGCNLDSEEALRSKIAPHLLLLKTVHFASTSSCTAAVFTLASSEFRRKFAAAATLDSAIKLIKRGKAVLFYLPDTSPNDISQQVMTADLATGLGLISAAVGPAQNCMTDAVARGYYRVLMAPETQLVYLPGENAVLLVYTPENLAFYLRGTV